MQSLLEVGGERGRGGGRGMRERGESELGGGREIREGERGGRQR